ncbi:MAG: glycosyltransferase, partial [Planctomycetes bacterium]|nr:glycosyltransferase [Planctomycetota bacterium]
MAKVLTLCSMPVVQAVITGSRRLWPKGWVGRIKSVGRSALCDLLTRMTSWAARLLQGIEEVLLLRWFERELLRVARRVRPDVLHAHSPYRCGVPALRVAWRLGIPLVYEVRGVWEESGVAAGRFKRGRRRYEYWRR